MKITLETTDTDSKYRKKITVEVPYDDLTFPDMLNELVFPALLGMGFSQSHIDELLGNDPEEEIGNELIKNL